MNMAVSHVRLDSEDGVAVLVALTNLLGLRVAVLQLLTTSYSWRYFEWSSVLNGGIF